MSGSFYGQCPLCGGDLDMSYDEMWREFLECSVCGWTDKE